MAQTEHLIAQMSQIHFLSSTYLSKCHHYSSNCSGQNLRSYRRFLFPSIPSTNSSIRYNFKPYSESLFIIFTATTPSQATIISSEIFAMTSEVGFLPPHLLPYLESLQHLVARVVFLKLKSDRHTPLLNSC